MVTIEESSAQRSATMPTQPQHCPRICSAIDNGDKNDSEISRACQYPKKENRRSQTRNLLSLKAVSCLFILSLVDDRRRNIVVFCKSFGETSLTYKIGTQLWFQIGEFGQVQP